MYVHFEGPDGQCLQPTVTRFGGGMFSVGMSEATAFSDHQTLCGTKRQLQSAMATQVPRNQSQAMELCYDLEFVPFQLQMDEGIKDARL